MEPCAASVPTAAAPALSTLPRRATWGALATGTILSLVVSLRITLGHFVLGSARGGWVHDYLYPFQFRSLMLVTTVLACVTVPAVVALSEVRRREWRMVALWFGVGLCAQGVLRALSPFTMEGLFLGDGSNGFFQPTLKYGSVDLLRRFETLRHALPEHPRTNMPGKLILIYALELVSMRPAVLAWLVVIISNIGGLFLYLFVRDWLEDRETALVAFVFYLFVPSKLLFFPGLNTVTPVFVLACAWLWVRLLTTRRVIYAAPLGSTAYLAVFFEPTPSVMGLLFVFLTAYAMWCGDISRKQIASLTAAVVVAFLATYALFSLVFRFDLVTTLRSVGADALEFNARSSVLRPYYPWVAANLLDLAFGAGFCQTILFCAATAFALRPGALRGGSTDGRVAALCLGTVLALAATDLAGINRGEVVRIWIFLACFLQIPAAYLCRRLERRLALMLVLGTTILQTALSASMLAFAQP